MFNNIRKNYGLIKLYISFEDASINDLITLAKKIGDLLSLSFEEFSLNFTDIKTSTGNRFEQVLGRLTVDQIEELRIEGIGRSLSLLRLSTNVTNSKNICELLIVLSPQDDLSNYVHEIPKFFIGRELFLYGYGKMLPENFNPVSETKVTSGLFSRHKVQVNSFGFDWDDSPRFLANDAIKGVFDYNFLSTRNLDKFVSKINDMKGFTLGSESKFPNGISLIKAKKKQ